MDCLVYSHMHIHMCMRVCMYVCVYIYVYIYIYIAHVFYCRIGCIVSFQAVEGGADAMESSIYPHMNIHHTHTCI